MADVADNFQSLASSRVKSGCQLVTTDEGMRVAVIESSRVKLVTSLPGLAKRGL